jgi:hypothetical protein
MSDDLFGNIERFLNSPKDNIQQLYTDEEYEQFIMAFATGRGEDGFTEEEATHLFHWLNIQRISQELISLVLKGVAFIGWDGTEPTFTLSPLGEKVMKSYDGT